jgi:protein-S-isoprenylcysteine O-methyltransferase Ste14
MQHLSGPVRVLVPLTGLVWFIIEARHYRHRRADAVTEDRGSRQVIRICAVAGIAAALVAARFVRAADIRPLVIAGWCGLVLLWCGIALRVWSIRTLGAYFTYTVQTSADQPIITAGPYRLLRHPSYTGILLAVAGLGFVYANWLSVVVLVVAVFAGLAYRITVEERALSAERGASYREFAATRKRLIPFIW